MNAIINIEEWGDRHHPLWTDFLRIILGLILILKGFVFAEHESVITNLVLEHHLQYISFMAAQYVVLLHICGGILIALGILTRFSSLMNLPILIAAVFFINIPKGLLPLNTELFLSIVVLLLLILFLIIGDGKLSAENFIEKHTDIW